MARRDFARVGLSLLEKGAPKAGLVYICFVPPASAFITYLIVWGLLRKASNFNIAKIHSMLIDNI